MFQQHQGETLYEAWSQFKDLLYKVPHHGIELWLQVQTFYDGVDRQTKRAIDYAANGKLSKLHVDKCWEVIEDLANYEEEEWEDPMFPEKSMPNHIHATQEQLFESLTRQVDELMKAEASRVETETNPVRCVNAVSRSEFPTPSRQEEFEGIMITFLNNQEKQIQQLESQLRNTRSTFMDSADIFTTRVKEKIMEESKPKKIEKVFELSTLSEPRNGQDKGVPFSKPYTISFSQIFKPTREKEDSRFHKIFVGSVLTTPYNFHEVNKRSFGFKPGVHYKPFKDNHDPNISHEQPLRACVTRQKWEYDTTGTLTDHTLSYITPCESNKIFDPGGMYYNANYRGL